MAPTRKEQAETLREYVQLVGKALGCDPRAAPYMQSDTLERAGLLRKTIEDGACPDEKCECPLGELRDRWHHAPTRVVRQVMRLVELEAQLSVSWAVKGLTDLFEGARCDVYLLEASEPCRGTLLAVTVQNRQAGAVVKLDGGVLDAAEVTVPIALVRLLTPIEALVDEVSRLWRRLRPSDERRHARSTWWR